jgi:azurin
VRLVLSNTGDMLHNLVVTRPGQADRVANAALAMGIQGPERDFVPASDDVLFHTALLQPAASESIYFVAPSAPGDYPFICSFPGHATAMRGVLHVAP